jgi:hypothetical protein
MCGGEKEYVVGVRLYVWRGERMCGRGETTCVEGRIGQAPKDKTAAHTALMM